MKNIKILILENDTQGLSEIYKVLYEIEQEEDVEFQTRQHSTYLEAEALNNTDEEFDVVLLDHDCHLGGSFDAYQYDANKTISISQVPENNDIARRRGVTRIALKTFDDKFSETLKTQIIELINEQTVPQKTP